MSERVLLRRALISMERIGRDEIERHQWPDVNRVWRELQGLAVDELQLEQGLNAERTNLNGRWVALPMDSSQAWRPILWLEVDHTAARAFFQVAILSRANDFTFGFRLETPEQHNPTDPPGVHHYHHVQFSRGVRPDGPNHGPDELPASFPTFPLEASSPAELGLALLLALYGFGFERTHINEAKLEEDLRRHYRGMKCIGKLPQPGAAPLRANPAHGTRGARRRRRNRRPGR
jgi:hypothetical protein